MVPIVLPCRFLSDTSSSSCSQLDGKILTYASKTKISSQATFDAAWSFETRRRIIATPASTVKKIKASCQWRLASGEMPQRVEVIFCEAGMDNGMSVMARYQCRYRQAEKIGT